MGFPIRRFTDQSLFAAPRDLSQRTTSFIASQRQGIHQTPLWHLIALIAKARQRSQEEQTTIRMTFRRLPLVFSIALRNAKRPVLLQTHPGVRAVRLANPRLVACRTKAMKATSEWISLHPPLLPDRSPATGCASSSRCQISDDRGRTPEDISPPAGRSAFPLPKAARKARLPAKLILHRIFKARTFLFSGACRLASVLCRLVEPDGIEPTTSCLQSTRSPN